MYIHFPYPLLSQYTVKQFINKPNFGSNIFTHFPPSAKQSKFFYQILYLQIFTSTPHQDTLYHNHYIHLPSSVPISIHFPKPISQYYTIKQVISRSKFSLIIITHRPPSAEQSTCYYQILYLLIILSTPHQDTLYPLNYHHPQLSVPNLDYSLPPPSPTVDHISVHQHTKVQFDYHHPSSPISKAKYILFLDSKYIDYCCYRWNYFHV